MKQLLIRLLLIASVSPTAHAVLSIDISEGIEGAQPIAVVPFGWQPATTAGKPALANSRPPVAIGNIIADDLRRSGVFRPLPDADLISHPHEGADVNYADWRALSVDNLVVGRLSAQADGSYLVQFQLFDVFKAEQMEGYSYPAQADGLRGIAHHISDVIYEKITGQRGAFGTRIAYVVANERGKKRNYSLLVADSDGHNAQTVLESPKPIMSPTWSPDGRQLMYVSFERGNGNIYMQSLDTGERSLVSGQKGINGAPAWSPDGRRIALTLSRSGNPEIYVKNIRSGQLTRITNNSAIDTEPSWSHDGKTLYFTSDRSGAPQIYKVSSRGGRAERLTFEGKYNSRPRVSPNGDQLAMVHGGKSGFQIAVMDLDTGALRVLSDGRLDESPSFSPNGAMILFAAQRRGQGVLSGVSEDGRVKQRLHLDHGSVREPAWSPFLD